MKSGEKANVGMRDESPAFGPIERTTRQLVENSSIVRLKIDVEVSERRKGG